MPAAATDVSLLRLARRVRRIVRSGEPWKLPGLLEAESRARGLSIGELVRQIEAVADAHGLSDRQHEAWRASPPPQGTKDLQ